MSKITVVKAAMLLAAFCLVLLPAYAMAEETATDFPAPIDEPGMTYGEGVTFYVEGLTLSSTEPIVAMFDNMSGVVNIHTEPTGGASSTALTVAGLAAETLHYIYVDGLGNPIEVTSTASGTVSFGLDLTEAHSITITTTPSTMFISDNATGGDCQSIGVWDNVTKTCMLTTDLSKTIQIDSNYITLDGGGHSITGTGSAYGVVAYSKSYVTVKNLNISNFNIGVMLDRCRYSTADSNVLTNNNVGVDLYFYSYQNKVTNNVINGGNGSISCVRACSNNLFQNNQIQDTRSGFYMWDGYRNTYSNNTVASTLDKSIWGAGLNFLASSSNIIDGNLFSDNYTGLLIRDATVCPYTYCPGSGNNIITNNTVQFSVYAIAHRGGFNKPYLNSYNRFYNNNFIGNDVPLYDPVGQVNYYSENAPVGGNYWSNYDTCTDADSDGFCDAPYVFQADAGKIQDNLPWAKVDGWLSPEASITDAIAAVEELLASGDIALDGTANSLTSTLQTALDALAKGNDGAATNKLEALINKLEAQSGKSVDSTAASELIELINQAKNRI